MIPHHAARMLCCLALAAATGCAARRQLDVTEARLTAAGFRTMPADTATKMARIEHVRAGRLVLKPKDGKPFYYLADPRGCRCVYVGDQAAYDRYDQMVARQEAVDSEKAARKDDRWAAAGDTRDWFDDAELEPEDWPAFPDE